MVDFNSKVSTVRQTAQKVALIEQTVNSYQTDLDDKVS